jgi:L-asparaginase
MPKILNEKFRITVITTGGTIDKTYDAVAGALENRGTVMKDKVFAKLKLPYTAVDIYPIMSKDSLYMTDHDRRYLSQSISSFAAKGNPIVVIHGTDTMTVSAKFCLKEIPYIQVPVVFTGAMLPQGYDESDALQNVTEALIVCKLLKPGFYLSFHNRVFEAKNTRKNRDLMTFENYDPTAEEA